MANGDPLTKDEYNKLVRLISSPIDLDITLKQNSESYVSLDNFLLFFFSNLRCFYISEISALSSSKAFQVQEIESSGSI